MAGLGCTLRLFLSGIVHTLGAHSGDIARLVVYCLRTLCHELGNVQFVVLIIGPLLFCCWFIYVYLYPSVEQSLDI